MTAPTVTPQVVDCDVTLPAAVRKRIRRAESGCWLWTGHRNQAGYGVVVYPGGKGARAYTHRWVWEQLREPIASGMELDHLCRVPACCNPEHLEVVTPAENKRRQARSTCRRGHDMANAYRRSDGGRLCRACNDLRNKARKFS